MGLQQIVWEIVCRENREMTLDEIYHWATERYPTRKSVVKGQLTRLVKKGAVEALGDEKYRCKKPPEPQQ